MFKLLKELPEQERPFRKKWDVLAPEKKREALTSLYQQKAQAEYWETRTPIHKFTDYESYAAAGSKYVWAAHRCCRIIAAAMLSAVYRINGPRRSRWLLANPNPFDSWEELVESWVFQMELTGNAYWLIDRSSLSNGQYAVYPLLSKYVEIIPHPKNKVAGYRYRVNGKVIDYSVDEVIHFKQTHPQTTMHGMGSVEAGERLYQNYINGTNIEEKFAEHGAMISGVLTKKEATEDEDEWERLQAKFTAKYVGQKNAGKIAFMNGEWAFHKVGATHEEMQAFEREKWAIYQIFSNHGVPLSVAGLSTEDNYATARQHEANFRKYKIIPLLNLFIGKINTVSLLEGGELTYEIEGLVDVTGLVEQYGPLIDRGVISRNELRKIMRMDDRKEPEADQLFIHKNYIGIEATTEVARQAVEPENPVLPSNDKPKK